MGKKTIVVGSRASALAMAQTQMVVSLLEKHHPDVQFRIQKFTTQGDRIHSARLLRKAGKGLFTKELERALLKGTIRMAVHSLKDVPSVLPENLCLGAVLERESPWDVYLSGRAVPIEKLSPRSQIGTSSLRRQAQIRKLYPHVRLVDLKGNLDTRIKTISGKRSRLAGAVVAAAGLKRLNLQHNLFTQVLDSLVPSPGQGALCIEIREKDRTMQEMLQVIHHSETAACVAAERDLMTRLEGGCQVPIGIYAAPIEDNLIRLRAVVCSLASDRQVMDEVTGSAEDPVGLSRALEGKLRNKGASDILAEYRKVRG